MEQGSILKPGQKIKLKAGDATADYIVQMSNANKLLVCKAVKQPVMLTPETYRMSIIQASDRGMVVIDAYLKESSGRGHVIALSDLSEPRFVQRREHYRLNHDDISVPFDIELHPQNNANRYKRLKLHDISAGGIGLIIKASSACSVGTHVNLTLNIDRRGCVRAVGEIVHITPLASSTRDFLVGISYVQIDKADLDTLMDFIQEQVDLGRKSGPTRVEAESPQARRDPAAS